MYAQECIKYWGHVYPLARAQYTVNTKLITLEEIISTTWEGWTYQVATRTGSQPSKLSTLLMDTRMDTN